MAKMHHVLLCESTSVGWGLGGQKAARSTIRDTTMEEQMGPDALPKCTRDTRGSVAPLAVRHQVEHTCPIRETCTRGAIGALLPFSADTAHDITGKLEAQEAAP